MSVVSHVSRGHRHRLAQGSGRYQTIALVPGIDDKIWPTPPVQAEATTANLPPLTDDETTIDAANQWIGAWPEGRPGVTMDGGGAVAVGLWLTEANRCGVQGLEVTGFNTSCLIWSNSHSNCIGGITAGTRNALDSLQSDGDDNLILGNYIGLSATFWQDAGRAALDTRGEGSTEARAAVLPVTNLVLFHLKRADPDPHHGWTSADNRQIPADLRRVADEVRRRDNLPYQPVQKCPRTRRLDALTPLPCRQPAR